MQNTSIQLEKIDDYKWQIPISEGMRVPGMVYADKSLLDQIKKEQVLQQIINAAYLPGIVKYSLAMPDIHWGYGLPIGGVVATQLPDGIISPGGVGSDINCGVRLIRTDLKLKEIKEKLKELIENLFHNIPSGLGSKGYLKLSKKEIEKVLIEGSQWVVKKGLGWNEDIEVTEEKGCLSGANPETVSNYAYKRGLDQLGTLGSGNHFIEVQVVEEISDEKIAQLFGVFKDQITVMLHSGSRGFGYQVCEDYLKKMAYIMPEFKISIPDKQLACAPFSSQPGKEYFGAMACAANYAWANRQCLMHEVRNVFEKIFRQSAQSLGMHLVYDVAHNIAKLEEHFIDGKKTKLCVHRKGATRCFPAKHPEVSQKYQLVGQPVIIPGDMGRNSYLLVGTEKAFTETFGSTCHGAGRVLSRTAAIKQIDSKILIKELEEKGILIRAWDTRTISEEAPAAYKDVNHIVEIVDKAGLSKKIAKMKPLAVIKG